MTEEYKGQNHNTGIKCLISTVPLYFVVLHYHFLYKVMAIPVLLYSSTIGLWQSLMIKAAEMQFLRTVAGCIFMDVNKKQRHSSGTTNVKYFRYYWLIL